ncbi:MAG: glycine cleavage system protein R [Elusimicrobiota bacterium]
MKNHFIIWAFGPDKPGIVAEITKFLFEEECNLEDSSMMRLGSEFGIFMIFTGPKKILNTKNKERIKKIEFHFRFNIGIKEISKKEAKSNKIKTNSYIVKVTGPDTAGIVFKITSILAKFGFNISDLSTHRTNYKGKPGYILFIEGEIKAGTFAFIDGELKKMSKNLNIHADIKPIEVAAL